MFKEEVERIRKETYYTITKDYEHTKANVDINRSIQFKSAVS